MDYWWKLQENIFSRAEKEKLGSYIQSSERYTQFCKVKEFESEWSRWQRRQHSVFVNSGSSADLLMLDAVKELYDIPDGAEVLVPAVTWTTNITSVIQAKLKPVFVDINLDDFSFDIDSLQDAVHESARILLVTHLIGIPANMKRLSDFAAKNKLIVLEDCCESHGAAIGPQKVGNFSIASTFSYYWGHHMTTIEGGMVCTDDPELYHLLLLKRSHGLARELPPELHDSFREKNPDIDFNFLFLTHGYNFRNTELHAHIGLMQLLELDENVARRNRNHRELLNRLEPLKEKFYVVDHEGISSFCLPFVLRDKKDRQVLQDALRKNGIETRPIIGGNLLRQPCFTAYGDYREYLNAEILHMNGFYVGNNQFVDSSRIQRLSEIVLEVLSG